MRKKIIKRTLSEIVVIVLLALSVITYIGCEIYLKSNELHEGQYALQHKYGARIVEVNYYKDLREIEGVEEFSGQEVDTKNWYLIDVYMTSTRHTIFDYKGVLVSADGKYEDSYKLTVKDGVAKIDKNSGKKYSHIYGEFVEGYNCDFDLYFTGNSLVLMTYKNSEEMYHYMEKVGMLPYYNAQIVQIGCAIAGSLLFAMYLLVAISKPGKKRVIIVAVCALIVGAIVFVSGRADISGEYINEDEDHYMVILPHKNNIYNVIEGNKINAADSSLNTCTWSDNALKVAKRTVAESTGLYEFEYRYDVYSSVTHMPVNEYVAFAYPGLCLIGSALGVIFKIKKKKNPDIIVKLEEMPFCSTYKVTETVFLCDSLKGMENYFGKNVKEEEVNILPESFHFMGDEISNPEYTMNQCKKNLYPESDVFKGYYVSIANSDYDLYINNKKTYLAKYMNGTLMVMYQLKRMEA